MVAEIKRLDGKSKNLIEENIEQLKNIFPEIFSEGRVRLDRLQELLGDYVNDDEEYYNFTWHGKRKAGRIAHTPSNGTEVHPKSWTVF